MVGAGPVLGLGATPGGILGTILLTITVITADTTDTTILTVVDGSDAILSGHLDRILSADAAVTVWEPLQPM